MIFIIANKMKIIEIPEELKKIYPIEAVNGTIKITGKDGSNLFLIPEIIEDKVAGYEMEYLTKKEVKEIDKLNKKQEEILKKIEEIKSNGIQKDDEKEIDDDSESANIDEQENE